MNNKVFLLVYLLLVINLFGCKEKETENYEIEKWERLNIQIISSYIENICLKRIDRISPINNYIEISGSKIMNEEKFDRLISSYKEKLKTKTKCNDIFLRDSIFNEENIAFFKPQYLAKRNYIKYINETDCIKNIQNQFPNEKVERFDNVKLYTFGKVLFTKNYEYGFLKFTNPNGFGFMIFKRNNKAYELYKHCQLGVF